ncbi:MAG: GntR family transcriptional regulator [Desulfobacteraceae bacterium]|nr:GntR family transcriptional regulator [Desulfobacteraceae bacterium]
MNKINLKTLHQDIAHQIREMIINGEMINGQKIDERLLCESMGVSRTPVREAIRILSSEGLIKLVPHKGAFLSELSRKEINEMFEVMSTLEGMCARLATKKMKEKDFQKIEKLHQELEQHYQNKDQKSYIKSNNKYHIFLQVLSGNGVLHDVINGLRNKILWYRFRSLNDPNRFSQSIKEHREILEAFRHRNDRKAEALLKLHLKKAGKIVAKMVSEIH